MQPASAKRSHRIFWIGLILTGILILTVPIPTSGMAATERAFRVEASRFEYTPAVLRANPGDTVTIDLVSTDVVHGLAVDGYGVEVIADPGQTARLTFIADRHGTFRFRCSATCGPMHPFMIGKLQVGQNELFLRGAALALLVIIAGTWKSRP
jgi:heme/copper-type cytochrome/quinol oxidase subunit 2